jgi:hypothetical protein
MSSDLSSDMYNTPWRASQNQPVTITFSRGLVEYISIGYAILWAEQIPIWWRSNTVILNEARFCQARCFPSNSFLDTSRGHIWLHWVLPWLADQAVVSQHAISWNDRPKPQATGTTCILPGQSEWSQPKHGVTKGFRTSDVDLRPEATLLISLS